MTDGRSDRPTGGFESMSEIVSSIASARSRADDRTGPAIALLAAWRRVAGDTIARRCRPLRLAGVSLVLEVPGPRWTAEIESARDRLLAGLREAGIGVRRIRCVVADDATAPLRVGSRAKPAQNDPALSVSGDAEATDDPGADLRRRLEKAASRYLEAASRRRDH